MQSDLSITYSHLFSDLWMKELEQKLDTISKGSDLYWEEQLNVLRLIGKEVVPYRIPEDNCRAEIIKLVMHKVVFKNINNEMKYVHGSCNGHFDMEGNTLFHHVAKVGLCGDEIKACGFIQEIFGDQVDNVQKRNIKGMTPFQEALCRGEDKVTCESVIPLLFQKCEEAQYDFFKVDGYGRTCLHLLASHVYNPSRGSWSSCEETISNIETLLSIEGGKALLNMRDALGLTAFDTAVLYKNFSVARYLWKVGADSLAGICSKEYDIDTVVASFYEREEDEKQMEDVYKYVGRESRMPDNTLSLDRLKSANISGIALAEAIEKFEAEFKSPVYQTEAGKKFLCEELEKVIDNASMSRINTQSGGETTLLHNAVASGELSLVSRAIKLGANPNIVNGKEMSPLGLAVINQRRDLVELLMSSQEDVVWPGLVLSNTPLSFYMVTTCKSAQMLGYVLQKEFRGPKTEYTETTTKGDRKLTYLEWAFVRQCPLAIFELLRRGGDLNDCAFFNM